MVICTSPLLTLAMSHLAALIWPGRIMPDNLNLPGFPRVLCIWGKADWISERKPIEWIAEIVNRAQPGQATFVALDSSDHFYFRAESMQESFRYFKPAKEGPFGEFNPAILETVQEWLDETSGIEKRGQK